MPNNRDAGALEDFILGALVPEHDPLLAYGERQVAMLLANARRNVEPSARFKRRLAAKVRLRMWLACQEAPALPPGPAILQEVMPIREARLGLFASWLRAALAT